MIGNKTLKVNVLASNTRVAISIPNDRFLPTVGIFYDGSRSRRMERKSE
jgi:hypothetical protein